MLRLCVTLTHSSLKPSERCLLFWHARWGQGKIALFNGRQLCCQLWLLLTAVLVNIISIPTLNPAYSPEGVSGSQTACVYFFAEPVVGQAKATYVHLRGRSMVMSKNFTKKMKSNKNKTKDKKRETLTLWFFCVANQTCFSLMKQHMGF